MVNGIEIVSVPVADVDNAKSFYRDVLGPIEIADVVVPGGMRWVQLAPPAGGPSITLTTWFPTMPAGSLRGLVLRVDTVEAAAERLSALVIGCPSGIEQAPRGRFLQIEDPDGNGLILREPAVPTQPTP